MFKVKLKATGEIVDVYNVYTDDVLNVTYFFIWDEEWCWRPASRYVPVNYVG